MRLEGGLVDISTWDGNIPQKAPWNGLFKVFSSFILQTLPAAATLKEEKRYPLSYIFPPDLQLTRERTLEIKSLQVADDYDPFATCDEIETLVCKECPSRGSWVSKLNTMRKPREPQPTMSSSQHSSLNSQGWVCGANAFDMIQQPES